MTPSTCHADIADIAAEVSVVAPTQYLLKGALCDARTRFPDLAAAHGAASQSQPHAEQLLLTRALERDLYAAMYCRPRASSGAVSDMLAMRDFTNALSAANTGSGAWEAGWQISAIEEDGSVVVARNGISFWCAPDNVRTSTQTLTVGAPCQVRVGKELRQLVPGFYMAIGNGSPKNRQDVLGPQVRVYWNLTAQSAVQYIHLMTAQLNALSLPFRTKVLVDPNTYTRADAGVLYIERRDFARAQPAIQAVYRALQGGLHADTPMFTKRLGDGLGLAEDPGATMSFGQSRCKLAAQALWLCYTGGGHSAEARQAALAQVFSQAGLDPLRPFLEVRSSDIYTLARSQPHPQAARAQRFK